MNIYKPTTTTNQLMTFYGCKRELMSELTWKMES